MEESTQGEERLDRGPEKTPLTRGPMASILTTDARQALAEASAAIGAIWHPTEFARRPI
jgi:hypothetical protein